MKRKLYEKLVIPIFKSFVLGVVAFLIAYFVKELNKQVEMAVVWLVGLLTAFWMLLYDFTRSDRPVFTKTVGTVQNANMTESIEKHRVEVWLETPDKRYGDMFPSPVEISVLSRIGWHITFLEGRISHPYLDTKWGILDRDKIKDLQEALEKRYNCTFRGTNKKGGMKLTDDAILFFRSISREYVKPTVKERELFNYKYSSSTPERKKEIRSLTNRGTSTYIHTTNM